MSLPCPTPPFNNQFAFFSTIAISLLFVLFLCSLRFESTCLFYFVLFCAFRSLSLLFLLLLSCSLIIDVFRNMKMLNIHVDWFVYRRLALFSLITDLADDNFYFILLFYSGKHCVTGTIPRDMRKDVGEDIFIVTSLQVFKSSSACP